MKHEIKPIASFGDIVKVTGYGDDLFAVDSYIVEYTYEPDSASCEIVYDLTCIIGNVGVFTLAEQADISVVCKAEEANLFLREYKPNEKPPSHRDSSSTGPIAC